AGPQGQRHQQDLGGAGGDQQVDHLADVVVGDPTLLHPGDDGGEVVVGDDQLGGLAGDVGPVLAHGDADVGSAEGGRVVDAVAGDGHEVPGPARRLDDA